MDIKRLGAAGLAGLLCAVTGSVAAALHYEVNAPPFLVLAGILLPPIVISLITWQQVEARFMAVLALEGVSWFSAFWTAVAVFHDGL